MVLALMHQRLENRVFEMRRSVRATGGARHSHLKVRRLDGGRNGGGEK